MVFELNKAIAENDEEKELMTKGKTGKKTRLYGTYIYKVLLEESSEDNTFTTKELCKRIMERFNTYIEISTITATLKELNTLEDYVLYEEPRYHYYLEPAENNESIFVDAEHRLEDFEIHYLVEKVRSSKTLMPREKIALKNKLSFLCRNEDTKNYMEEKALVKQKVDDKQSRIFTRLLQDLPEILENDLVMEIKVRNYGLATERTYGTSYVKFYLYAVVPFNDNFILIGSFNLDGEATCLFPNRIEDYRFSDERFDKVKLKIRPNVILRGDKAEILQTENPTDFIFPSEKELENLENDFQYKV